MHGLSFAIHVVSVESSAAALAAAFRSQPFCYQRTAFTQPNARLYFAGQNDSRLRRVAQADTFVNLTSSADNTVYGQNFTLTATVAAVAPSTAGGLPTGCAPFVPTCAVP